MVTDTSVVNTVNVESNGEHETDTGTVMELRSADRVASPTVTPIAARAAPAVIATTTATATRATETPHTRFLGVVLLSP
jgi:hypothetical protein